MAQKAPPCNAIAARLRIDLAWSCKRICGERTGVFQIGPCWHMTEHETCGRLIKEPLCVWTLVRMVVKNRHVCRRCRRRFAFPVTES